MEIDRAADLTGRSRVEARVGRQCGTANNWRYRLTAFATQNQPSTEGRKKLNARTCMNVRSAARSIVEARGRAAQSPGVGGPGRALELSGSGTTSSARIQRSVSASAEGLK